MDRTQILAGLACTLMLGGCSSEKRAIRVGSKNFTEQVVLGEIIAQHIENRLHAKVERKLNLGGTLLAHQALRGGEIDLYPEYSGTALASILKQPLNGDSSDALTRVQAAYKSMNMEWLAPLGIDNGFAMVIRGTDARAQHLETLSDAARSPETWKLGVGYEFEQRADGLTALDNNYHLRWTGKPATMDLGLLYRALDQNLVTMIAANATDGLLSVQDLKVLADDRHAFPPYELSIAVREEALQQTPGLREVLLELSGKFDNRRMQDLNYQVDGLHRPVAEVARDFLKTLK